MLCSEWIALGCTIIKFLRDLVLLYCNLSGCQTRPSTCRKTWVLLNPNPNGPNDMVLTGVCWRDHISCSNDQILSIWHKMWSLWHAHFDMVLVGFLSCMLKRTTFPSCLGIGLCKLQYANKNLHNTYFYLEKSSKTRSCAKELTLEPYTRVVCACGKLLTSKLWTT